MRSFLGAISLLYATTLSAGVAINHTQPRLDAIVSRGSLIRFSFVAFTYNADERDVTVDFSTAPAATIEAVSGKDFNCTNNGTSARCVRSFFPLGVNAQFDLDVRMPAAPFSGQVLVNVGIRGGSGSTYTALGWVIVARPFPVLNAERAGAGSFADALEQANIGCNDGVPCQIDFQIPGATAFTIDPDVPLPQITGRNLTIDGHNQVVLDGSHLPSSPGLSFVGTKQITVRGLTFINWGGPAIQLLGDPRTTYAAEISDNEIGPGNLRGIMSYDWAYLYVHDNQIRGNRLSGVWVASGRYPAVYENVIDDNGASGVYFGPGAQFGAADENHIWSNRDFGVAVDPQARWIEVRGNSMKDNGQLGIDFALDLVTPNVTDDSARRAPNAPVLTSAIYDALTGKTVMIGHVDLRKPSDVGYFLPIVDIYRSSALGAHGMAQGEAMLFNLSDYGNPVKINAATGDFTYIHNGDLTGQYITATYSRMYALGKGATSLQPAPQYYENWQATSEFSNPMRVTK